MKFEKFNKVSFYHSRDVSIIHNYLKHYGTLEATDMEIENAWKNFSKDTFSQVWLPTRDIYLKFFVEWLSKHYKEI